MEKYIWEIVIVIVTVVAGIGGKIWLSKRQPKSADVRTNEAVEKIILELLNAEWPMRKFTTIKSRLGGLSDDEIRQALLRVGAVKFKGEKGEELWGLKEKNKGKISPGIQKWS